VAVSFVSPRDVKSVAEIEKLIKTKIEIEPVEFDEDRPDIRRQGRFNEGHRLYDREGRREEGRGDARAQSVERPRERSPERGDAGAAERRRDTPRPASRSATQADPFFDRPYEATATEAMEPASWEAAAKPVTNRSNLSTNIRPKRKLAALFKQS
jgi:hypothetical protein